MWLRLSGVKVNVKGLEQLDPKQPYVFISNHWSYLDAAPLFAFTGRRMGLVGKKELLKAKNDLGPVQIRVTDLQAQLEQARAEASHAREESRSRELAQSELRARKRLASTRFWTAAKPRARDGKNDNAG